MSVGLGKEGLFSKPEGLVVETEKAILCGFSRGMCSHIVFDSLPHYVDV